MTREEVRKTEIKGDRLRGGKTEGEGG